MTQKISQLLPPGRLIYGDPFLLAPCSSSLAPEHNSLPPRQKMLSPLTLSLTVPRAFLLRARLCLCRRISHAQGRPGAGTVPAQQPRSWVPLLLCAHYYLPAAGHLPPAEPLSPPRSSSYLDGVPHADLTLLMVRSSFPARLEWSASHADGRACFGDRPFASDCRSPSGRRA